jgi:D-methionine transport system ATP-binding protein
MEVIDTIAADFDRPQIAPDPAKAPVKQVVVFEKLEKVYASTAGRVHALRNISLTIPSGVIYGIIGRSGAGKSTLLRTINRLERPTSGRVLVDGEDIAELDREALVGLRRRVGMIFQHFNLLSAKTVWDNVALPLVVAGASKPKIEQRVAEVLALVGLEDKHKTYPSRLSGGQKQRVGIARALAARPKILLCDEATSALDPETTLSILELLRDINRKLGLTIILITHEMSVIREICDHVLVLEEGQIAEAGPVWRVFGDPWHEATRSLLQPLARDLPDDIAARLRSAPALGGGDETVIELRFTGEGGQDPDLSQIADALRAPVRLIHGGIDRIQGRAHGRLLIATRPAPGRGIDNLSGLAHSARVLGYVSRNL